MRIIGCSNDFPMTVEEGVKNEQDAEWLRANVVVVDLPDGETWYVQSHEKPKPCFSDPYVSPLKAKPAVQPLATSYAMTSWVAPWPVVSGGG